MTKYVLAGVVMLFSMVSFAQETRCGWLENPTPANLYLIDRDGVWNISMQGGRAAAGMDNLKAGPADQYVAINGGYGYSCACLKVSVDKKNRYITKIFSAKNLPLDKCRNDKAIQQPESD